jgi:hypothetical protein
MVSRLTGIYSSSSTDYFRIAHHPLRIGRKRHWNLQLPRSGLLESQRDVRLQLHREVTATVKLADLPMSVLKI